MKRTFLMGACIFFAASAFCGGLPGGHDSVQLGMSLDSAKSALKSEIDYGYRGERDVSLLPGENRTLIETSADRVPSSYFTRCYFQFYEDKLCVITLGLNTNKLDYFSVFTSLVKKYGDPEEFSPDRCQWRDSSVILTLEKPLTIRYTDAAVRQKLLDEQSVEKSVSERLASEFLDSL